MLQFVVHPLPGSQEQLYEKLRAVAERINRVSQTQGAAGATGLSGHADRSVGGASSSLAPPGSSSAVQGYFLWLFLVYYSTCITFNNNVPPGSSSSGPSSSSTSAAASSSAASSNMLSSLSNFCLSELSSGLRQIEVGPSHFAFLLNDGRICRLPFSVISDRLDLNRNGSSGGKNVNEALQCIVVRIRD